MVEMELKNLVDEFEALEDQISDLRIDQKGVLDRVNSSGYDKKAFKKVISLRKLQAYEREQQEQAVKELMLKLGM